MFNKKVLVSIVLAFFIFSANAQNTFQKLYTPTFFVKKIHSTLEQGTIIAGMVNNELGLIKRDSTGTITWSKSYSTQLTGDEGTSVIQTPDSGFIAVGGSFGNTPGNNVTLIIKVDQNGNLLWQEAIPNGAPGNNYDILKTADGNYLITGSSSGSTDLYFVKINEQGVLLFARDYSLPGAFLYLRNTIETKDGGFLLGGYGVTSQNRPFLMKVDVGGNFMWGKSYDSTFTFMALTVNKNGCYAMGHNFNGKISISKIDSTGHIIWNKHYSGTDPLIGSDILKLSRNNLVVAGGFGSAGGDSRNYLLLSVDSTGGILWSKTYGNNKGSLRLASIAKTPDNSLLLAGNESESMIFNSYESLYFLKTDSMGTIGCHENTVTITSTNHPATDSSFTLSSSVFSLPSITITVSNFTLQTLDACLLNDVASIDTKQVVTVSPNPFHASTTFSFPSFINEGTLELFEISGRKVSEQHIIRKNSMELNRSALPAGIYLWKISGDRNVSWNGKVAIE